MDVRCCRRRVALFGRVSWELEQTCSYLQNVKEQLKERPKIPGQPKYFSLAPFLAQRTCSAVLRDIGLSLTILCVKREITTPTALSQKLRTKRLFSTSCRTTTATCSNADATSSTYGDLPLTCPTWDQGIAGRSIAFSAGSIACSSSRVSVCTPAEMTLRLVNTR